MRKYVLLAMVFLSGSVSAVNISTNGILIDGPTGMSQSNFLSN